ncbi:MAG TPA: DNA translocase FtsK [Candidatus Krumholzibacteria bacterium]|nr:DNA translocase FtsK [Candidatus Krumholzibacteria bacterium]
MRERMLRGFALAGLWVFFAVSWLAYSPTLWPAPVGWRSLSTTAHPCGPLGLALAHVAVVLLGRVFSIVLVAALGVLTLATWLKWSRSRQLGMHARLLGIGALGAAVVDLAAAPGTGGVLGRVEIRVLLALMGKAGTTIVVAALVAIVLVRYGGPVFRLLMRHSGPLRQRGARVTQALAMGWSHATRELRHLLLPAAHETAPGLLTAPGVGALASLPAAPGWRERVEPSRPASSEAAPKIRDLQRTPPPRVVEVPGMIPESEREERPRVEAAHYACPPLTILQDFQSEAAPAADGEYLALSRTLEEKLADFGIGGRVSEVQPGPVITTYEFEPAPGIKVSQVTSRVDDLAMALRAQSIRMVAPIPGKAAIGIEIPNGEPQMVALREIMQSWADDLHVGALGLALGKTVSGEPFFADLAAMPHLLVAGATGSGKSVCINVILCSLLLRHDPTEVKLLLIDPKMLELNAYRDIPHLLHPVVTDPKEAYKALHWMTVEMERRYRELARAGVRNIVGYNKKVRAGDWKDETGEPHEVLPYVVVVVDELADLMIQVGGEIETPIARLAQMARAVGIHLVVATQRPSVDVITGVIKANFPCRIAFQVSSRVDSRTILDGNGAEALLGRGDMLLLPGGRPSPIRLHGAFVSVEECERIAAHWRSFGRGAGQLDLDDPRTGAAGEASADDDLFETARELVVRSGVASVSYLQRRLKVGYSRAARIMDMLEEAQVVGPGSGAKAREILERPEDLPQRAE